MKIEIEKAFRVYVNGSELCGDKFCVVYADDSSEIFKHTDPSSLIADLEHFGKLDQVKEIWDV
jgi:hypothetical protein